LRLHGAWRAGAFIVSGAFDVLDQPGDDADTYSLARQLAVRVAPRDTSTIEVAASTRSSEPDALKILWEEKIRPSTRVGLLLERHRDVTTRWVDSVGLSLSVLGDPATAE
jgi:hypothetical protein